MKDRARALLNLVEADRNRIYGAHRIFLRAVCKIFPDIEAEARQIVTAKARALIGKKGMMIHQEYRPEEPTIDQELDLNNLQETPQNLEDFKSCLKGIAKRLIVTQSCPSNSNVAQLMCLASTPIQFKIALKVMSAQRWHLRAGQEPLSSLFLTKVIRHWDDSNPEWYNNISEFLESAISRQSNHAIILTPKTLQDTVEAINIRLKHGSSDAERLWSWTGLAIRLLTWSEAYCGPLLNSHEKLCATYLSTLSSALIRLDDPEFKVPQTDVVFSDFLASTLKESLNAENIALLDDFVLANILKLFVKEGKTLPDFVTSYLNTKTNYLKLFTVNNAEELDKFQVEADPQLYDQNIKKFLQLNLNK